MLYEFVPSLRRLSGTRTATDPRFLVLAETQLPISPERAGESLAKDVEDIEDIES